MPTAGTGYGANADRYAPTSSAPSGNTSNLSAAGTNYNNSVQSIAPPTSYNRSTTPTSTPAASVSDNRYGDSRSTDISPYNPNASTASAGYGNSTPVDRYAPTSDPATASRYTPPSSSLDGSNPSGSGYGTSPGYAPSGAGALPSTSPYAPPSTSAPTGGSSNDIPAYRPGSVTKYNPSKSGSTVNGIATTPDTASPYGVTPASYER